jgi:hypothetical protein
MSADSEVFERVRFMLTQRADLRHVSWQNAACQRRATVRSHAYSQLFPYHALNDFTFDLLADRFLLRDELTIFSIRLFEKAFKCSTCLTSRMGCWSWHPRKHEHEYADAEPCPAVGQPVRPEA